MNTIDFLAVAESLGRREAEIGEAKAEAGGLRAPRNELCVAAARAFVDGSMDAGNVTEITRNAYLAFVKAAGRDAPTGQSLNVQVSKIVAFAKGGENSLLAYQHYGWMVQKADEVAAHPGADADDKQHARELKAKSFDKMVEIGRKAQAADRTLTSSEVERIVCAGMTEAERMFKAIKAIAGALKKGSKLLPDTFEEMAETVANMLRPFERAAKQDGDARDAAMKAWEEALKAEAEARRAATAPALPAPVVEPVEPVTAEVTEEPAPAETAETLPDPIDPAQVADDELIWQGVAEAA